MGAILLKNIATEEVASNILIEDNYISKVVPADVEIAVPEGAEVVDCTGKAVLPGFVNMHTHAGMAMMRGVGEDIAFHEWIKMIKIPIVAMMILLAGPASATMSSSLRGFL